MLPHKKGNGGKSIAVYHPNYEATESTIELAEDGRVDFIAPADYTKDSKLFKIVSNILKHMAADYEMDCLTYKQNKIYFFALLGQTIKKQEGN